MDGQRVAVVTGTSTGMGLHAAIGLAAEGFHVVATVRSLDKAGLLLDTAAGRQVTVEPRELEVTDDAARTALIDSVLADHGRIDVLINNAGRGIVAPLEELSLEQLQGQLDVNYLSAAMLTRAVIPTMRAQGSGRILTVTSVGGAIGQPFADAYCGAKFAVEGLMQSLAPVLARFGIQVGVIEPAATATEFFDTVGKDLADTRSTDSPYAAMLDKYLGGTDALLARAQSAAEAGASIVAAVMSAEWRFRWQTSDMARQIVGVSLADVDGARVAAFTDSWI